MSDSQDQPKTNVIDVLKRLLVLHIDNIKLTTAEKLTVLLSAVAIFSIVLMFSVITLIFIAIGIANLLEDFIAPYWSYLIIAGMIMVLIGVLILLKDKLIINPIARFISKLIVNPPKK